MITESADEYVGVRTTDLVGFVQRGDDKEPVFLAPGLTVDQPMVLRQGFQVESFGNRYVVTSVTDRNFHILRLDRDGESRERAFHFEDVVNPEESFQKNLIRARTRYQLTRQHVNGQRDYITFDFPRRTFKVRVGIAEATYKPGEFQNFLELNAQQIVDTFNSNRIIASLRTFTENIDVVVDELMLPDIQTILRQTWKSS